MSNRVRQIQWEYRRGSENPFHSLFYNVLALGRPVYHVFGFTLCIARCRWCRNGWRPSLAFVGW